MTNLFKITGTVTLKKGAGRQLKSGGMWVYDNEIDTFSETVEDGALSNSMISMITLWE